MKAIRFKQTEKSDVWVIPHKGLTPVSTHVYLYEQDLDSNVRKAVDVTEAFFTSKVIPSEIAHFETETVITFECKLDGEVRMVLCEDENLIEKESGDGSD